MPQLAEVSHRMRSRRAFATLSALRASHGDPIGITTRHLSPTIRRLLETPPANIGTKINVRGWVRSIRKQKAVTFITVNDGSSVHSLQVVVPREVAQDVSLGCSISCEGTLEPSPGPNQPMELQASLIKILGSSPTTYPIQKKAQSAEFLRRYPHLRTRTPQGVAMMRLRDKAVQAFHQIYQEEDFLLVQPPILTANDSEGAGEAFRITTDENLDQAYQSLLSAKNGTALSNKSLPLPEFFDQRTYLTVSTQLHLEALTSSLSRVYTISPVFRAEPSQTHRHVSEFSMMEAELAFCEDLEDVMSLAERTLKGVMSTVRVKASQELDVFQDMQLKYGGHPVEAVAKASSNIASASLSSLPLGDPLIYTTLTKPWARMTYHEAVKELESFSASQTGKSPFQYPVGIGLSLQSEHEKWLAGTLVGGPVFVTDYPAALKPFYMRSNIGMTPPSARSDESETVACFDLLVPRIGELVGGSLREERIENLVTAMDHKGIPQEGMEWYVDLRRYGSVPHGGFGLGFERFISWLTGFENIRECMPFPRAAGKIQL